MVRALITAAMRPILDPNLPDGLAVTWFDTFDDARTAIADVDIAWVDPLQPIGLIAETIQAAGPDLKWVSTSYAGLDMFPLDLMRTRGIRLTGGSGVNAAAVADYAVMGVLVAAKRLDEVVRARDRREWLEDAPGKAELSGTKALVIGFGRIGRMIGDRLKAFAVEVTGVTHSGRDGTWPPTAWRDHLGDFDWIILSAPSTRETKALVGAHELAAMMRSAWIINVARGDLIDDVALLDALTLRQIAGAFIDIAQPEPLPPNSPLWTVPNALLTMHLSGRSQTTLRQNAGAPFLKKLAAFRAGEPLQNLTDLQVGY